MHEDPQPLIVRADGDARMGIGHLVRSGALADEWCAFGGAVTFVSSASPTLLSRAVGGGVRVVPVPRPHPDPADAAVTAAAVAELSARGRKPWLALDGYHFDASYRAALRAAGAHLMVIDDATDQLSGDGDVVLNQNIGADLRPYPFARPLLLLGPRFALVRAAFSRRAGRGREISAAARRILVTLGGADPDNVTVTAVRGIGRMAARGRPGLEVAVVLGSANPRADEVRAAAQEIGCPTRIFRDLGAEEMAGLMEWADVAVAAGGSTCWELACLGLPSALVALSDNQHSNVRGLADAGAAVDLGDAPEVSADRVADALAGLAVDAAERRAMSHAARRLVDGGGTVRIVRVLDALTGDAPIADRLTIRLAEPADVLALWRLSNDPGVRESSFDATSIPLETHLAWYRERLSASSVRFWVAELEGTVVAVARYERIASDLAELYYAVVGPLRRRGVGAAILDSTWALACEELSVPRIRGVVLVYNSASMRALLRSGFSLADKTRIRGQACLVYERAIEPAAVRRKSDLLHSGD